MAYKAPIWEDGKSPAISAENLNNLSQAAECAQVLYGNSAPTSSTEGAVGQFYLVVVADSDGNYPLYQCVAIANGSYVWRDTRRIPDSITSMLGIPAPGTINGALNVLANVGNLHVWKRVQTVTDPIPEVPAGYTLGEETSGDIYVLTGSTQDSIYLLDVTYGDSVSVDKNGNVSIVSPTTKTSVRLKESEGMKTIQSLVGKYVTFGEPKYPDYVKNVLTGVFYIPPTATVTVSNSGASTTYIPVIGYPYTPVIPAGTTTDYLTSTDRNAYPDQSAAGGQDAYYSLGDVVSGATIATLKTISTVSFTVKKSDSVNVSENGIVSLPSTATENTVSLNNDSDKDSIFSNYKGCFIQLVGNSNVTVNIGDVIWIPSDAVFSGLKPITVSKYQPVTGHAAIPANTTITYLGQLGGGARIEVGSYVGTGTESADISVGFTPKAAIVSYYSSFEGTSEYSAFILPELPNKTNFVTRAEIIEGGFRVYYYNGGQTSRNAMLNASGSTYRYIAIG